MPRFAPIASGRFTMGSDEGNDDERPARLVQVDAFHVSVHAITVDQYAAFVRDTGHPAPSLRDLPLVVTSQHEPTFRELAAPRTSGVAPIRRPTAAAIRSRWSVMPMPRPIAAG